MTVLLTLERYIAVCWPLKSKRILTQRMSIAATVLVLVFSICLNIPRWDEAQRNTVGSSDGDDLFKIIIPYNHDEKIQWKLLRNVDDQDLLQHRDYRTFYHGLIWVTLMYGIPIPLLAALNFIIWNQVSQSQKDIVKNWLTDPLR